MIERSMAATNLRRVADGPSSIPGRRDRSLVCHSLRQVRGDRRRQRATCAVRVPARQARPADLDASGFRDGDIDGLAAFGVPTFTNTTRGPSRRMRSPASRMSASERIGNPASASASGMFGVTMCASGSSSDFSAATAAVSSRRSPPFAIMTGSTTIGTLGRDASVRATALTIAALASIPILIASAPISPSTASICCTTSGVHGLPCQHAERVLRRDRSERARAVDAVRGKRLEIRLDPGAAAESLPAIVSAVCIR